ncbi:MAG: host specificity protein [Oscillibacter sp.]|nr:host specificity protein [Oscillibacter sp.]
MNRLVEKFKKGEPSAGTFAQLNSPMAVECLGPSGLDYVLIDTEHSMPSEDSIASAITAADAAGLVPLVRINQIDRVTVLHPLDYGAQGLIVPAVETVEEVRQLVRYAKFQPVGHRGFCPSRDGGWGYDAESLQGVDAYFARCNRETLLIPQCETVGCLEHIEEIMAMEGVDGIFVGPFDLSIALGCPMAFDSEVMQNAMKRVLDACKANHKMSFIFCGSAQDAKKRVAQGYDSVTIGSDSLTLAEVYRNMAAEFKA